MANTDLVPYVRKVSVDEDGNMRARDVGWIEMHGEVGCDVAVGESVTVDVTPYVRELALEALEAGYKNALAQIALTNMTGDIESDQALLIAKRKAAQQLVEIYDTAKVTVTRSTLEPFLRTFQNYVESVRVVARRLTRVDMEEREIGDMRLPIGLEVEVAQLHKLGMIVAISTGYKNRPYYKIQLRNPRGEYEKNPEERDLVHCYARDLVYNKADLICGKSAAMLIIDDPLAIEEKNG